MSSWHDQKGRQQVTTMYIDWDEYLEIAEVEGLVGATHPRQTKAQRSHELLLARNPQLVTALIAVLKAPRRTRELDAAVGNAANVLLDADLPAADYDRWLDFVWSEAYQQARKGLAMVLDDFTGWSIVDTRTRDRGL